MVGRLAPRQRRTILAVAVLVGALAPVLAAPAGAGAPVCNTTPIVFTPPPVPTQAVQRYLPYPSNITVAGLTGTVTDVNVSFLDISYVRPEDIEVLLVAPDGSTNLMVMSDIGGDNAGTGLAVTDVDLTFDDEAASVPSADGQLVSGTYRPLNDADSGDFSPDTFPAPAPTQSTATALSVFDGVAPNGTWSLYVVDDEPGPFASGDFGGGWCIDITTGSAPTTSTTRPTTTTTSTTLPPTTTTRPTTTTTSTTRPTTTTTTLPVTTTTTRPTTTTTTLPVTTTTTRPTTTTTTTPPTGEETCGDRTATIVGTPGGDNIVGTDGADVIAGLGGDDKITGLDGDDVICSGGGNDVVEAGAGNDTVSGGDGNDRLVGQSGRDLLRGGEGNDDLVGGSGDDDLVGGAGNDECLGGTGDNTFSGCESTPLAAASAPAPQFSAAPVLRAPQL